VLTAVGYAEGLMEGGVAFLAHPAAKFHAEQGGIGNAPNAVGAAGDGSPVVEQNPDDFTKAERNDGEIVTS